MRYITHYWGKARPAKNTGIDWHPVAYHSLDVAATMEALLRVRPRWLTAMAKTTGLPENEIQKRLVLVAALHDLGKFAENFQQKVPELAARFGHSHKWSDAGHGTVGGAFWERHSGRLELACIEEWLFASVSHHGTPVESLANLRNAMSPGAEADALAFATAAVGMLGLPDAKMKAKKNDEIWRVAGLTILADWIGSNRDWFCYTEPNLALDAYWDLARTRAAQAMAEANLNEAHAAPLLDLKTFLGAAADPSPLQAWAESQMPAEGPQLYLIEDLTGAGKTEAALILANRLMRTGAAEGIYWALPSMATANGLYERLKYHYHKLFYDTGGSSPSLVLAHSARDLNDAFQLSIREGIINSYGSGDQDISAEATCAAFIAEDRKKTFLAQIGVGTLDQALLGALPVRHQALRLAALSRRVLIIDEAHAYDEYMTNGLEHLLKFQKALGGSSIILSATLTQAQKRRFAAAYGADANDLTDTAFPMTTRISADGTREEAHQSSRGTRRDLPCKRFDDSDSVLEALLEQARARHCGVYIRNSVREALQTFQTLKTRWDKSLLFHARFCLGDRLARENDILSRFGKQSMPEQREGWIVVATQVVEQSLDLDFDFMATDLCPMDLLIQRAGRLHRHDHRPPRPDPSLWVVASPASDDVREDWYSALFKSGQYVYPDTGQLWRTMRVVEESGGLKLASGSPRALIEPVFGSDGIETPPALEKPSLRAEAKRDAARGLAHLNFLGRKDFTPQKDAWAKDVHTPTRLGDETITLRLAMWNNGKLKPWIGGETKAWRLSEISVRKALCASPVVPDGAAAQAIDTAVATWMYPDPPPVLALTPTDQDGVWRGRWTDNKSNVLEVAYSSLNGLWLV